ncbi:MAG TPA: hypothetical protein VL728_06975 [Cyclobacteriaceae bacterium]|jgi:hypothetical protein|nr:hypothetical protein [Cyclobacteriaceae bacterium]
MRIKYLLTVACAMSLLNLSAQNLLNKIKSKASQEVNKEVNKLESPSSNASANSTRNKLSNNVTRTVAVNLREGESFDYSESCIDLGSSVNQISFIVNTGFGDKRQCFSYKNGSRTPVPCPNSTDCGGSLQCSYNKLRQIELDSEEGKKYIVNETEAHQMTQPTISDQQLKAMAAYMTKEQIEQMKKQLAEAQKQTANQSYSTVKSRTIQFNEKKYGPYSQLSQFYLTSDNTQFYAVTLEVNPSMQYTYKVISSASTASITIQGATPPMSCVASTDNSEFAVMSINGQGKYYILTSQGKTIDLADAGNFRNVWYSSVGNHLMVLSGNNVFYDGQVIKTFENNSSIEPCNLYVASDGKGVSLIKDNIVSFADGDHFEYPLKIALVNNAGKMYFKWLALENQEVVIYQKPY